jgi:uncharacterized DUF497 family protein
MDDGRFQWDDAKAASNRAKHSVSFEKARLVFDDVFSIGWLDNSEDYGEDRFVILDMAEGRLLYVVYTMRGESARVISARGAQPNEQRRYHEQNAEFRAG